MMRRLFGALLLKGLWKFKPIHVIAFWCFMAYQGWMASPYFMYYVVGAPEPGTAPRYVGTLRIEGETTRGKSGLIPPRYYLDTEKGEIELHCGYRPRKFTCTALIGYHSLRKPSKHIGEKLEIAYHPYWGIEKVKSFTDPTAFAGNAPGEIEKIRISDLDFHTSNLVFFMGLMLLYAYLIWQAIEAHQESSSSNNSSTK
jgi:hypothetical protein